MGIENIYSIFNINYLKNQIHKHENLNINKYNLHSLNFDKSITKSYGKNNPEPPIIIESKFSKPYEMVDGNHRFIDKFKYKPSVDTAFIKYSNLNKNMFINKFNFAVYLFANESNELAIITSKNPIAIEYYIDKSIAFCNDKLKG